VKVFATAWRLLRGLLLALAALVIFFEEWGWRPITAFVGRLAQWPPLKRLEAWISAAPPRVALLLFLAPALGLLPVKLGALWLIEQGRAGLGLALIVAAKLVGTALAGRLFILLERQLMTFAWFARIHAWWNRTRATVAAAVRRSAPWRALAALRRTMRAWWRRKLGR
jgi:hypothetical protein